MTKVDFTPVSQQTAAACSKFYGDAKLNRRILPRKRTVTCGKAALKKNKYHEKNKPRMSKRISSAPKTDGDPNWQTIDEIYENPNSDSPLSEYVGVSREAAAAQTVLDHFLLFFQFHVIDQIVNQTNLFYNQFCVAKQAPMTFQTSRVEMMAFFAIVIAMGLTKLPDLRDYWRSGTTSMPWFRTVMSRNRFTTIMWFLPLTDNSMQVSREDPNCDRFFKLGNLHKILNSRFSSLNSPQRSLSIDEQMIGTKCQVSFRQYIPKSPRSLE